MVMNFSVAYKTVNFLTSQVTISFSRWTLLHRLSSIKQEDYKLWK